MNKITVIGNLVKDPEIRSTSKGNVTNFRVAVSTKGEPMYYNVAAWGARGDNAAKYLTRGSKVFVEGELSVGTWTGNNGKVNVELKINPVNIEYLSARGNQATTEPENVPAPTSYDAPAPAAPKMTTVEEDDLPW